MNPSVFEEPSTAVRFSLGKNRFDAHPIQREVQSFQEFQEAVLSTRAAIKGLFYIASAFTPDSSGKAHRSKDNVLPTSFLCFDFDSIPDQEAFAELCMYLSQFQGFGYTTASHTLEKPRARAILALDREVTREERIRISHQIQTEIERQVDGIKFDQSVYRPEQPCFTPVFESESFTWDGMQVEADEWLKGAPDIKPEGPSQTANVTRIESTDPVLQMLKINEMVKKDLGNGRYAVVCPCSDEHSGPSESETATVYTLPKFNGFDLGNFTCLHDHCANRPQREFLEALGMDHGKTRAKQAEVPNVDHSELKKNEEAKIPKYDGDSYSYSLQNLKPVEFVIDGFMSNKVTIIAGPPGVGKTSILVPLACNAAHLCDPSSQLKPALRRRVAYITEDPEQVERILYGMRKHGNIQMSDQQFHHWFEIIPARRLAPGFVALMIEELKQKKKTTHTSGYEVEPLIILDTSNATINLENENDNAQAGRAIAEMKQVLGTAALWIVAHTSKVASREEVSQMSARGAGAFEGDANAVCYIINQNNVRFLVLGKRRFEAEFSEVRFESHAHCEDVMTPWGLPQKVWYRYGLPFKAEAGEREELREKAKEDGVALTRGRIRIDILKALADSGGMTIRELRTVVQGKNTAIGEEVEKLTTEGRIRVVPSGDGKSLLVAVNPRPFRSKEG